MPRFDGTGPRSLGPMTGQGEGYCALALPSPGTGRAPYGYAGLAGRPVQLSPDGSPAGRAHPRRIPPAVTRRLGFFLGTRLGRECGRRRVWRGGRRR
jgi:hypothetical protein